MTIAEDIARMKLQTLLEYQASYQAALSRTPPSTLRNLYTETLILINEQIARLTPLVPVLPSEEELPF